eukprot:TRINITY_DN24538_c0_g1_i4.p1 TRINITY_DN24538_c0_g1~~TRINITY_DN24538_c0_g1_i4.p1  ORF type:complete len:416 (+),score=60.89 TRINITY_DN24538_c0_g1_i4:117-1364(+)
MLITCPSFSEWDQSDTAAEGSPDGQGQPARTTWNRQQQDQPLFYAKDVGSADTSPAGTDGFGASSAPSNQFLGLMPGRGRAPPMHTVPPSPAGQQDFGLHANSVPSSQFLSLMPGRGPPSHAMPASAAAQRDSGLHGSSAAQFPPLLTLVQGRTPTVPASPAGQPEYGLAAPLAFGGQPLVVTNMRDAATGVPLLVPAHSGQQTGYIATEPFASYGGGQSAWERHDTQASGGSQPPQPHIQGNVKAEPIPPLVTEGPPVLRPPGHRASVEWLREKTMAFQTFDVEDRGFLDYDELKAAMRALDLPAVCKASIQRAMAEEGCAETGEVDFEAFSHILDRHAAQQEPLEASLKSFQLFDRDGCGRISVTTLRRLAKTHGLRLSDADISRMIDRFDVNRDGEIDEAEFVRIMAASALR